MAKKKPQNNDIGETRVVRARLDHFTIYEVSENELNSLEHGTNSDVYLEFAIMCISSALGITATLTSGTFKEWVLTLFILIVIVCSVIGLLLLCLWYRGRRSRKDIITSIRDRLKDFQSDEEGSTSSARYGPN